MAKLKTDEKEMETPDGEHITEASKELGLVFGCEDGVCGTCLMEVEEGMENLTEKTEAENNMGIEGNQRLACQCKIKSGDVKIKY